MAHIYYNSWLDHYKTPFGAMQQGETVTFSIDVQVPNIETVYLVIVKENSSSDKKWQLMTPDETGHYQTNVTLDQGEGLYFYYFSIQQQGDKGIFYGAQNTLNGEGQLYYEADQVNAYQLTCFKKPDPAPDWYRQGVCYQLFPDRFFNGNPDGHVNHPKRHSFIYGRQDDEPMYIKNERGEVVRWDFQGGNFLGIRQKIPYLKALGITTIYLNPIFEANSNHRYDTGDYLVTDGILGDNSQFKELIDQLHDQGIKLILDGVFNHVGKNSRYFNFDGQYGTNVGAFQTRASPYFSWFNFSEYPNTYKSWWGVKDLPEVKKESPSFQQFIYGPEDSVLTQWNEFGVDGWRLDVADELPDFFIQGIRQNLMAYDQKVLLGEVWEDASNKIAYDQRRHYILGDSLHGVMNYPFRELILALIKGEHSPTETVQLMTQLKENYPKDVLYNNLNNIGTHDTERILSVFDGNEAQVVMAFSLMIMLPGVPCLYYGDEVGLTGGKDPENRKSYPWGQENNAMLTQFKQWISLRKENTLLQIGDFQPFATKELFGVIRYLDGHHLIYLLNPTTEKKQLKTIELTFASDCHFNLEPIIEALDQLEIPAQSSCIISESGK